MNETERAISVFEEDTKMTQQILASSSKGKHLLYKGVIDWHKNKIEANCLALQALKAQAEREQGCERCNDGEMIADRLYISGNEQSNWLEFFNSFCNEEDSININYCPICGSKLGGSE